MSLDSILTLPVVAGVTVMGYFIPAALRTRALIISLMVLTMLNSIMNHSRKIYREQSFSFKDFLFDLGTQAIVSIALGVILSLSITAGEPLIRQFQEYLHKRVKVIQEFAAKHI